MLRLLIFFWQVLITTTLLTSNVIAQQDFIEQFPFRGHDRHAADYPKWQSELLPNGKLKTHYKPIARSDSFAFRSDYYPSGNLKAKSLVFQLHSIDTSYTENLETGELEPLVQEAVCDAYHGKYMAFADGEGKKALAEGYLRYNARTGTWKFRPEPNILIIAWFEYDHLIGDYKEFYVIDSKGNQVLKTRGKYGYVTHDIGWTEDLETGELVKASATSIKKVGTWKYYDISGQLIKTEEFAKADPPKTK